MHAVETLRKNETEHLINKLPRGSKRRRSLHSVFFSFSWVGCRWVRNLVYISPWLLYFARRNLPAMVDCVQSPLETDSACATLSRVRYRKKKKDFPWWCGNHPSKLFISLAICPGEIAFIFVWEIPNVFVFFFLMIGTLSHTHVIERSFHSINGVKNSWF